MIKKLLYRAILEKAIQEEEWAFRFYEQAMEKASDQQSRVLLKRLCGEELRHRLKLQELQSRGNPPGLSGEPIEVDYVVSEEELPEIPPEADRAEILGIALKKEGQSYRLYHSLAENHSLKFVRAAFLALSQEEYNHIELVKAELEAEHH